MVEKYRDFGGIRIEDDILVTETGCKNLSAKIPKKIDDVEKLAGD
jgi:Xaa-Pro aminopeptidase